MILSSHSIFSVLVTIHIFIPVLYCAVLYGFSLHYSSLSHNITLSNNCTHTDPNSGAQLWDVELW